MQRSFDSRWSMSSAKLGGVLWVAIAVLVFSGRVPGVIGLLFLLAPLVVVPLGFEILDRYGDGLRPAALGRAVRMLQPLGAMLAVASFWFSPGLVAGALSSAWLAVGALTALMAILDALRPGRWSLERLVFNMARIDLAIAGCWFVTSRLGVAPMGFQEPIVLLTGVHFHYSGFATALIAGVTLKFCAPRRKSRLAAWIVVAAVFVPFLLAAGFVFSPVLRMIFALILAVTLLGFSLLQISVARDFTSALAGALLRIAAGLLIPGMLLVMVYAVGEYTGSYWLVIPQMAHLHGALNGPGFVLLSLVAWVVEKSYRRNEGLRSVGEIFPGGRLFLGCREDVMKVAITSGTGFVGGLWSQNRARDLLMWSAANTTSHMREDPVAEISAITEAKLPATAVYKVLYDGQCEICQACVSWLKTLDRENKTVCLPISAEVLSAVDARLGMDDCLRQLHVVTPEGEIHAGWDAVTCLARLFPSTWLIGSLGQRFPFRNAGRLAYGFVAANRYSLSKCRGGACRVARPETVRRQARLGAFWSCYTLGFLIRLPLVVWAAIAAAAERTRVFARTYRKRLELLDGKLTILFLNGALPNTVPLLFGELFTAILYDGIAIDPGSPKMRGSLARHLRQVKTKITKIVATHAHEEHVGNLSWLSELTGAPIYVSEMTARFLMPFKKLPWVRATIIGQPPSLKPPFQFLGETVDTNSGQLQVIASPGHCDDHLVLYDPNEKVLLAGDAFMGSYFATPNPDVDSRKWLASLERLIELDIEILVEGHGHIHTLRADVPDFPGVVIRQDPKAAIAEKLEYMRWLREQMKVGFQENLPLRAIEASCFPWGRRSSWESFATDECIRLLSLGHFSRTELVRSFVRSGAEPLPSVYAVRMYRGESGK